MQVVFPVVYHDKFYKDVLEAGELAKLAYYNDIVVGAVCCRVDVSEEVIIGLAWTKQDLIIVYFLVLDKKITK